MYSVHNGSLWTVGQCFWFTHNCNTDSDKRMDDGCPLENSQKKFSHRLVNFLNCVSIKQLGYELEISIMHRNGERIIKLFYYKSVSC